MTQVGLHILRLLLHYRKVLVVLIQLGLVVAAYVGSFILRLDLDPDQVPWDLVLRTLPLLVAIHMASLALFRLYRGLWTYVSVVDLVQIIRATTVGVLAFAALEIAIFGLEDFPRSVFILNWVGKFSY